MNDEIEKVRERIGRLIIERGLNFAQVSLAIGKNVAYIQQFVRNGSPRRLGEVERHKLAQILDVDEQDLTDLPIASTKTAGGGINTHILTLVIEKIEAWLSNRGVTLNPHDKADLIRLIYMKVSNDSLTIASEKVHDFIEIYDELRKAN